MDTPPAACVELQMLLVPRSDTSDADKQYRCDFAVHKIAVVVNHPLFDASVNVGQYAAPVVEHCRVNGIFKELQQHGHIYHCAEYFIEPLQFLTSSISQSVISPCFLRYQ